MINNKQLICVLNEVRDRKATGKMAIRTKRLKNQIIKSSVETLLKQLSGYWRDLPVGELRTKVGDLVNRVEDISVRINEAFPPISEEDE